MKYKHILIICLMICIIFNISSVYANDMNDTDMQQDESIIEISNEEDNVLSSNMGTFSDLYNEIQNADSELKLIKNYKYTNTDSEFIYGIPINKPITIDGNGFTINGNRKRALNIRTSDVILKNIHFENCFKDEGGALTFNNAKNCEIINSTFSHNGANDKGGCIYLSSSNLKIENTFFSEVNSVSDLNSKGGCIYAISSMINIKNTSFNGNNYARYGGSIFLSDSTLIVSSSNFTNNHADDGGCIFAKSSSLTIENSNLIKNRAIKEGGTIYISNSNLIVSSTNFTENVAKYLGSAIYSSVSMGIFKNCKFKSNRLTNKIESPLGKQYVLDGCLVNCDIDSDNINELIGGSLKDYTTELKVSVINNIVDITVVNPDFYNEEGYFLTIEKSPFPTSHNSWSPKDSIKLYNGHAIVNINNIQLGLNEYRVYYSNFINNLYYYFNITRTEQSSISINSITGQRGTNALLKINVNDKTNVYSYENKGDITLIINGETYNYPVKNGESEILITLPRNAGTFNYNVIFTPYSKYVYSSSAILKVVSKYGTEISIKSVTGYQGKKVKLTATVKDDTGNKIKTGKVTFKIAGKTYSTNVKNGVASITIKYPKAKWYKDDSKTKGSYRYETSYYKSIYTSSVTFKGDGKYMSSSKTFKVTSKGKPIKHKYRLYNYRTFTLPVKNTLKFYHKGNVVLAVGMKHCTTKNILIIGVGDENDHPIPFKVQKHYKKNGKWKWDSWFYCDEDHYMETKYGTAITIDKVRINCYSPYFVKIY